MPGQCWDGIVARLKPRRGMQSMGHRSSLAGGGLTTVIVLSVAVNVIGWKVGVKARGLIPAREIDPFFLEAGN